MRNYAVAEGQEAVACIKDGPRGGETLLIDVEADGSPPQEIELSTATTLLNPFEESSLRHSVPLPTSTYRRAQQAPRDHGGYVYKLVRN